MKTIKYIILWLMFILIGCVEKGVVNVDLSQGYSEFTIESKDKVVKGVNLQLSGEASCEVSMLVSKQDVDTIGTGHIDWEKTYPWRAGAFKVKLYSPKCSNDGVLKINYAFKK